MQPRAFISYSWTSADHERWVLDLATELVQSGVDIILDKWELREGQDKYHFMEMMVKDPSITKVIIIADCAYARKADERVGGVGTESQVISKEVYDSVDQSKFVAVLKQYDDVGRACLPTFFSSRIYIDMSDEPKRRDNFERLVRWLFDKPQFEKPVLGRPPEYIASPSAVSLGTSSRARHVLAAVRGGASNAAGAIRDYLDVFASALVNRDFQLPNGELPGDAMMATLDDLLPARDEFVDVLFAVARYSDVEVLYDAFGDFFESMLSDEVFSGSPSAEDERADVIRYFIYELVLYYLAALLKQGRYSRIRAFFERWFLVPQSRNRPGGLSDFTIFAKRPQSLVRRGEKRQQRFIYLVAELVKQRSTRTDLTLTDLAQADFVALLYTRVNRMEWWRPYATLCAAEYQPLPLFLRATSKHAFSSLATVLGVSSVDDLTGKLAATADAEWTRFWEKLDIETLMNARALAVRP